VAAAAGHVEVHEGWRDEVKGRDNDLGEGRW
jgi:hypothetical protein